MAIGPPLISHGSSTGPPNDALWVPNNSWISTKRSISIFIGINYVLQHQFFESKPSLGLIFIIVKAERPSMRDLEKLAFHLNEFRMKKPIGIT